MAENTERITILLQARDKDFARAMDRNNKLISRLERDSRKNMTGMARNVESGLSKAGVSIRAFAAGAIGGILAGAIAQVTTGARGLIAQISSLAKTADRIGINVEDFQGLERGFSLAGVSADGLSASLEFFTEAVGSAADGQGKLFEILSKNGIAIRDQSGQIRPTLALFRDYAGIISRTTSEAERLALTQDAFGRAGRPLANALAGGSDAIDDMIASAREGGFVLNEELVRRAEILDDRFDDLTRRAGVFFKTIVVEGADAAFAIADMTRALGEFRDEVAAGAPSIADLGLQEAVNGLSARQIEAIAGDPGLIDEHREALALTAAEYRNLAAEAQAMASAMLESSVALRDMGEDDLAQSFVALSQELSALSAEFVRGDLAGGEFSDRLWDISSQAATAMEDVKSIDAVEFGGVISRMSGLINALARVSAAAVVTASNIRLVQQANPARVRSQLDRSDNVQLAPAVIPATAPGRPEVRPGDIDFGYMPPSGGTGGGRGGGGGSAARLSEFERLAQSTRDEIAKLNLEAVELAVVAQSGVKVGDAMEYARRRAELLYAAQADGRALTPELRAEIEQLAMAYVVAGDEAERAAERLDAMKESAERGANAISDIFLAAIDGADSAKEAIGRLLMEIARVQAQQAFLDMAGTGGFFGFLGSALGGARAGGGGVRAGVPYLVNENTANSEVMVPSRSGGVLNVAQAKDALRGSAGGTTAVFNIDARGAQIGVAEQIERKLRQMTPDIVRQSVGAVYSANSEVALR